MKFLYVVDKLSGRLLPLKFSKHYLRPLVERRKQVPFDVVNAIGVMFHAVDDALWEQAVASLGRHLAVGGV